MCIRDSPITAQFQLNKKIELFGGVSFDLLFGPSAGGTLYFLSRDQPQNIEYLLALDYNFRTNDAGQVADVDRTSLIINGLPTDIFRSRGAYYDFSALQLEEFGKLYNLIDASAILGFNFFLNRAFYVGLRGELGLLDKTNSRIDFSRTTLSPTNTFVTRDDRDVSINLGLSFGFRF